VCARERDKDKNFSPKEKAVIYKCRLEGGVTTERNQNHFPVWKPKGFYGFKKNDLESMQTEL